MRTFFLFFLLSRLLGSPLLALVVLGAMAYLADARWNGRWFLPGRMWQRRQAMADLRRTIERNEHDVGAHSDLGRLLVQQGRYEQAFPHLERAIRRMEESPETNFYYGVSLLHTGRSDEGERRVRRALEINPRFLYGEPQVLLARTHLERDAEEARRWAEQAVKLNTSSVEGWVEGFNAAPERTGAPRRADSSRMPTRVRCKCGQASTCTVSMSAPRAANSARYFSGSTIIRCRSSGRRVRLRIASRIGKPIVMFGTKRPSITSMWS